MKLKVQIAVLGAGLVLGCGTPDGESAGREEWLPNARPPSSMSVPSPDPIPDSSNSSASSEGALGNESTEGNGESSTSEESNDPPPVIEGALAAMGAIPLDPPLVGSYENSLLAKKVDARIVGDAHGFEVLSAYVTRPTPNSSMDQAIITLRNEGSETRCYIDAGQALVRDAAGNILAETDGLLVEAPNTGLPFCVAPGEVAYVLELLKGDFDRAALVELAAEPGDEASHLRSYELAPTSARTKGPHLFKSLITPFKNVSTSALGDVSSVDGKWLLVAEDGTPLRWGPYMNCESIVSPITIEASETIELCAPGLNFDGSAGHLVTWVTFIY